MTPRFTPIDPLITANPSPNYSSRHGRSVGGIVIHYTGGPSAVTDVRWMTSSESAVASHFVISRTGHATQLVQLSQAAWHAGLAEVVIDGECEGDVNSRTIGIELSNLGLLYTDTAGNCWYAAGRTRRRYRGSEPIYATLRWDNGHEVEGHWEPYPDAQIDALLWLLGKINAAGYPTDHIVGHEEIAMPIGRKIDPGAAMPWDRITRLCERRTSSRIVE